MWKRDNSEDGKRERKMEGKMCKRVERTREERTVPSVRRKEMAE